MKSPVSNKTEFIPIKGAGITPTLRCALFNVIFSPDFLKEPKVDPTEPIPCKFFDEGNLERETPAKHLFESYETIPIFIKMYCQTRTAWDCIYGRARSSLLL
jgi:hypothetical protein